MVFLKLSISENNINKIYEDLTSGNIDDVIHFINEGILHGDISQQSFGKEIGEIVKEAYNNFYMVQVHAFIENLKSRTSPEIIQSIQSVISPVFELTKVYSHKFSDVYQERLSREIRNYLRNKDIDAAAECAVNIVSRAKSMEDLIRFSQYIGSLTGSLPHDQKAAESMISLLRKKFTKLGYPDELIENMEGSRKQRFETIYKSRMENAEIDWVRTLTQTIVDIKNKLPDRFQMREPAEQEMSSFRDLLCAIMRIPFFKGNEDKWIDIITVLVDFCPHDLGGLASMVGAEPRAYTNLGLTAKRVVNRNFEKIGKIPIIQKTFQNLSEKYRETIYFEKIIEIVGAFRSETFYQFLKDLLLQKKFHHIRGTIINAIGQVAGIDSRKQLLELLAEDCQGIIDPKKIKESERIIIALGKIIRHPGISVEERKWIIKKVTEIVPKQEKKISLPAALNLFGYKSSDLDDSLLKWGISVLVESLWLTDDKPEFAKGEERPTTILGFRESIVNTLIQIGQRGLPEIIRISEQNATRYSGAFLALGEVFNKIGNETTLPLIDKILLTSFMTDDSSIDKYHKEFYWDPSDQQKKPLDKDKIISSLLYAVSNNCGNTGEDLLQRIYNQIQAGRLINPGSETAKILVKFAKKESKKPQPESGKEDEELQKISSKDLADIEEAIEILNSRFFLKSKDTRRREKIRALQILGNLKPIDVIPLMIKQVEDGDILVRSAAVSALSSYGEVTTSSKIFRIFISEVLDHITKVPVEVKAELMKMLINLNPGRKIFFEILTELKNTSTGRAARLELEKLLEIAEENSGKSGQILKSGDSDISPVSSKQKTPEAISDVEKKRLYLEARRAWIAGGKKGKPPDMPT